MQWETIIGLEVHIQLDLESKLFATDATIFGSDPNTNVSPVTLAHPGTLPVVNRKAFDFAIRMGLACNCSITKENYFDRKHYFYPDLPKGFQTTQHATPVCTNGEITARLTDGTPVTIALHHIHLEEDAGKSIHDMDASNTLIDLNRAGTALLELVTDPVIKSSEEAYAFLAAIRKLVRYVGISDGNMEEGSLRCDANVSLRKKGTVTLGVKTEIKNLNSMRFLQKALEYEIERQGKLLDAGEIIVQETRGYNSTTGVTYSMREKESAHDYRYFPEPDIPPVYIKDEYIQEVKNNMPALPEDLLQQFTGYGLSIQEALQLTDDSTTAEYYIGSVRIKPDYRTIYNWMTGPLKSLLNEHNEDFYNCRITPEKLLAILQLVEKGTVSYSSASQRILPALYKDPDADPAVIAEQLHLILDNDDAAAEKMVKEIMLGMQDKIEEYKKGRKGLLALFIGEAMKKSQGKYKPEVLKTLIQKELE